MASKKNLSGKKFERLIVISEHKSNNNRAQWNCLCECGEYTVASTNHLTSGNTKSCGCLKVEMARKNQKKSLRVIRKYQPHITSARRLWRGYCDHPDKKLHLSFEEWFKLSRQPCHYCGVEKYNNYNYFKTKAEASRYSRKNGNFSYNGLDKIISGADKFHTIDNIVPCCPICNRAKSERSVKEFSDYIKNLTSNNKIKTYKLIPLPGKYLLTSVKIAFKHYKRNYGKMEIDLETFYTYSQRSCYYCGTSKSNLFNVYLKDKKASLLAKENANFYYNGIDRLDNTKKHSIDNIVPCCCYCNFAKSKLSLSEFYDWIDKIRKHQK